MRTVSTVLALVLFSPASGAEPTYTVTNKIPPTITVTNRIPTTTAVPAPAVAVRPFTQGQYFAEVTDARRVAGQSFALPTTTRTARIRIGAGMTGLSGSTNCVGFK